MSRKTSFKIRLNEDELGLIRINAANAQKPISAFVRDLALGSKETRMVAAQKKIADNQSNQIAFEIRKIGAMMRGFYPKNDMAWTNEDKKRYWDAMETLLQKAYEIAKKGRC